MPAPDTLSGMTDPAALELARLDAEIRILAAQAEHARRTWEAADWRLNAARQHRAGLATDAALLSTAARPTPPVAPAAAPVQTGPESSTRTVQNVLFILGGLLLGTAAIVFTAVAWATYGVGGRAVILAAVTALTLATPLVALRRHLTATAETFAAVGLLLVVLDGYAAWYVNLFGVADRPGAQYAGLVALVTAVVAASYGALTGLTGPRFIAVVAMQPVAPLLAVPLHPTAAGWSFVATGVAAVNLLIMARIGVGTEPAPPERIALRVLSGLFFGLAVVTAGTSAAVGEGLARTGGQAAIAGLAVIAVAASFAAATELSRQAALRSIGAAVVVLALTVAGSVYVGVVLPHRLLLAVAAVVAGIAILARVGVATRLIRGPVATGTTAGGLIALGGLGLALTALTLFTGLDTLVRVLPAWQAPLDTAPRLNWELLAAIGLAATAAALYARWTLVVAAVMVTLALPDCVALPWWAPSTVDIAVAAVLAFVAVRRRPAQLTLAATIAAAGLGLHGLLASLGRPSGTAAVLGALILLGIGVAWSGRARGANRPFAGSSLVVGLLAVPGFVASVLVALDRTDGLAVPAWWSARLTVVAIGGLLVGLVAVRRWWPELTWYAYGAVLASAALWPAVTAVVARESVAVYGGVGLLLVALALLAGPSEVGPRNAEKQSVHSGYSEASAGMAAISNAVLLAVGVLPTLVAVLAGPYAWLGSIWTGAPTGVGLDPYRDITVPAAAAWGLGLLALASATATYAVTRRIRAALGGLALGGPTAVIVGVVAAGAPWPSVPAAALLLGLVVLVVAAVAPVGPWRTASATVQGVLYVGAGVAGALPAQWSTIVAWASIVVTAAVVGTVGRTLGWRVVGGIAAVAAALNLAAIIGAAADLPLRQTAPLVLAVAAAALAGGAALSSSRPTEGRAVSAAAHAGAVVAILLALGWTGTMATLCAAWGVAIGLRALWHGTSRSGRAALAAAGAGYEVVAWWLLLADRGVSVVEAYTVPLALVGLLAGFAVLRARPELRSWVSYGPALAAGFLPSLALVLAGPGAPWRRLLLGLAALLVVLAGSVRRRQAPVVAGGGVLVILALHEIALAWDHLQRWIPLGVGGLILVGFAITYERRRRDLARLRAAVGRMS